jgi:hypothetical protein
MHILINHKISHRTQLSVDRVLNFHKGGRGSCDCLNTGLTRRLSRSQGQQSVWPFHLEGPQSGRHFHLEGGLFAFEVNGRKGLFTFKVHGRDGLFTLKVDRRDGFVGFQVNDRIGVRDARSTVGIRVTEAKS